MRSSNGIFPGIAPSRILNTNSLFLIICPLHEWRLFSKICKLHWLIQTSMRLASLETNDCLRKWVLKYKHYWSIKIVYISDTVLFVYNGLHSLTQSDTHATRVWNCDFTSSPWETGDFTVCSVSLKKLCIQYLNYYSWSFQCSECTQPLISEESHLQRIVLFKYCQYSLLYIFTGTGKFFKAEHIMQKI